MKHGGVAENIQEFQGILNFNRILAKAAGPVLRFNPGLLRLMSAASIASSAVCLLRRLLVIVMDRLWLLCWGYGLELVDMHMCLPSTSCTGQKGSTGLCMQGAFRI